MTASDAAERDHRVLLLAPTRKDAITTAALLRSAAIPVMSCSTFDQILAELAGGAGVLIVPEEAITPAYNTRLAAVLRDQPPWSDLPVLVLAHAGAASETTSEAMMMLGNVTVLERPLRVPTLLSAVRTALRARQRQYQIREHLEERARGEDSLRLADRRKDEFLATLGHELRNPLAPLLAGMQLLRLDRLDAARAAPIVEAMERQITYLVRLVDDLLEVSRITRGLIDVRHDAVDLVAVVRAAIDTSGPVLETAGHTLTTVHARSDGTGRGSEFLVELPLLANVATAAGASTPLRRLPDRRILVVDDNQDAAQTLGALLKALGANVSVVHSGRSALESLDRFDPDAMLLDIGMPDMDGYEVARKVRSMPDHAHTLLIALSGWGQDHDYGQSRAAGFDHHMVKPLDIDKLRDYLADQRQLRT